MSDDDPSPKYEYLPWDDDEGLEQCVRCGTCFGAEEKKPSLIGFDQNGTYGPVVNADRGTEYEYVCESPPGTRLAHSECFKELDAERKAEANASLADFGGDEE